MKKPAWWDRYFRSWPDECENFYNSHKENIHTMITEVDYSNNTRKRTFIIGTTKTVFADKY